MNDLDGMIKTMDDCISQHQLVQIISKEGHKHRFVSRETKQLAQEKAGVRTR